MGSNPADSVAVDHVNLGEFGRWAIRQFFGKVRGAALISAVESIPTAQFVTFARLLESVAAGNLGSALAQVWPEALPSVTGDRGVRLGAVTSWALRQGLGKERGNRLIQALESIPSGLFLPALALIRAVASGRFDPVDLLTGVRRVIG